MTGCGVCSEKWSGLRTCHCGGSGCHQTFTGLSAFDAHRRGGQCNAPDSVGLSLTNRDYPCWGVEDSGTNPWRTAKAVNA